MFMRVNSKLRPPACATTPGMDRSARPEMILKPLGRSAKSFSLHRCARDEGRLGWRPLHIHRSDSFLIRLIRSIHLRLDLLPPRGCRNLAHTRESTLTDPGTIADVVHGVHR